MTAESENQASFKLPPVVAANVQPDPLESLRSPQLDILNLKDRSLERDSVAGSEFNDIALDDDVFSPVALTARPVVAPDTSIPHDRGEIHKHNVPNNLPSGPVVHPMVTTIMDPPRSHKKTASTTTIRSIHTRKASLLVNRLDLQEPNRKNRGSVDGHLKLQEEFHRLHERENQKEHTSAENTIDWGASPIYGLWSCVAEYEDLKIFGEL